jgi:hypothetical protein
LINIEEVGTISDAVRYIEERGGMIFKSRSGMITKVIRGNYCITFYDPKFNYQKLQQSAIELGIDPWKGISDGGLIRRFLKEVIKLNPKDTYFGRTIKSTANHGWHWGYFQHQPHPPVDCIELDVKAAYLSSLLTFPSLFFHEPMSWEKQPDTAVTDYIERSLYGGKFSESELAAWRDDHGAISRLRQYAHIIPKDLRLKLVGIIAAQQYSSSYMKDGILQTTKISKIDWGGSFNAVQLAIYRLWYTCREAAAIAGEYCIRWHTDGGVFRCDMPRDIESKIVALFTKRGFTLRCKGAGLTHFWDLNTGFIGAKKFVGNKEEVLALIKSEGMKLKRHDLSPAIVERWWHLLINHKLGCSGKSVYGYFQKSYTPDADGYLQEDGGIFYCFCCDLDQRQDTCFTAKDITQYQIENYLVKI